MHSHSYPDIVDRLKEACNGHPAAKIAWPHRLLHDAIAEIERLRGVAQAPTVLDELESLRITASGLQEELKSAHRQIMGLEKLRPVWAFADVNAQVASAALAQIWERLGATNQTDAMLRLSALPSTQRLCTKCGSATKGEEAFVNGEIWCHPCADAITVPSAKPGDAS